MTVGKVQPPQQQQQLQLQPQDRSVDGAQAVVQMPPNPPKEYRRALKDKLIAQNTLLGTKNPEEEDKYAYLDKKLASLNVRPVSAVEKIINQPGETVPTSSMHILKQQTPNMIPMPNPELMLRNVSFQELADACNKFSPSNLIGKGGFGEVYIGRWNGQRIAVKRIREDRRRSLEDQKYVNQAITELQALHNYPAENVLPLLAFSFNIASVEDDPCLVYLYMANGSVADRLRCKEGTDPLSWDLRANIALGTARGLCHLHANNIIHGDIKSANILLDRHFEPKIGDFGLARGGPDSNYSFKMVSSVQGTASYLPLDYVRSRHLTLAVDTFCYGIVMFELVSGKSPSWTDPQTGKSMRDIMLDAQDPGPWIDGAPDDPPGRWPHCLFFLGRDCTKSNRRKRPEMRHVLSSVESLHQNPALRDIFMAYPKADNESESCLVSQLAFSNPQIPKVVTDDQTTENGVQVVTQTSSSFSTESDSGNEETNKSSSSKAPGQEGNFEIPSLPDMSFYIGGASGGANNGNDCYGVERYMAAEAAVSGASELDLL